MDFNQEWQDKILKEIMEGKTNEEPDNTGKEPTSNSELEHDLRHNPPQVHYLVKVAHADRHILGAHLPVVFKR